MKISEFKNSIDLVELIRNRVGLKRNGDRHVGLCPFHDEKTPSFYVAKNRYHCFACGVSGDAISWVMHWNKVSFHEALDILGYEKPLNPKSALVNSVSYVSDPDAREAWCREHLCGEDFALALIYEAVPLPLRDAFHVNITAVKSFNELELICEIYHLPYDLLGKMKALSLWEELCRKWSKKLHRVNFKNVQS